MLFPQKQTPLLKHPNETKWTVVNLSVSDESFLLCPDEPLM